ncbi:ATP-dependent RNA helicase [Sarracenia purpurea var. burkii]
MERKSSKNVHPLFSDFCKAEKGILLCTDVAARGLDIPAVVLTDAKKVKNWLDAKEAEQQK